MKAHRDNLWDAVPTTDYGPKTRLVGLFTVSQGFSHEKTDDGRLVVRVDASPTTPSDRIVQIGLARAAELTLEEGHLYFQIVNETMTVKCLGKKRGFEDARYYRGQPILTLEVRTGSGSNAKKVFSKAWEELRKKPTREQKLNAAYGYLERCPNTV